MSEAVTVSKAARTPDPLNKLDLADGEKRVVRLMKTAEGRQALRNMLGYNFEFVGEQREQKKRVAILVPSHIAPSPETTDAFAKMVAASREVCEVLPLPSVASSVVHWVRNELLIRLYRSGMEFDYVLFMDDDIVPEPDHLVRLLKANVDIVAGACTVRQDPPLPNFRVFEESTFTFRTAFEWNGEGLMEIGGVGTGLMLISKRALELTAEYYVTCQHERRFLGMSDEVARKLTELRSKKAAETHNRWWFEFLKHPLGDGEYGEDISFCFKARQMGVPVHVDTTIRPKHMGRYGYGLEDYFFYQKQVLGEQGMVGERATTEVSELLSEVEA